MSHQPSHQLQLVARRKETASENELSVGLDAHLQICCVCSSDETRTKDTCNLLLTLGVKISVILKKPITKKKKIGFGGNTDLNHQ